MSTREIRIGDVLRFDRGSLGGTHAIVEEIRAAYRAARAPKVTIVLRIYDYKELDEWPLEAVALNMTHEDGTKIAECIVIEICG